MVCHKMRDYLEVITQELKYSLRLIESDPCELRAVCCMCY